MENLAPDLVRQRLIVEGFYAHDVNEEVIRHFFERLISALDLRAYGTPTIFAPGGEGRTENQGYDAFIPLIDSGISLYVWSGPRFLSLIVFSCKRFDSGRAVALTRELFQIARTAHQEF